MILVLFKNPRPNRSGGWRGGNKNVTPNQLRVTFVWNLYNTHKKTNSCVVLCCAVLWEFHIWLLYRGANPLIVHRSVRNSYAERWRAPNVIFLQEINFRRKKYFCLSAKITQWWVAPHFRRISVSLYIKI